MDLFTYDGVEIAYEQRGAGRALLFLHNGGASSTIWRHQTEALSAPAPAPAASGSAASGSPALAPAASGSAASGSPALAPAASGSAAPGSPAPAPAVSGGSYRTVAVDLPGFGSSPRPAAGIDLAGQVELLGALIDHLDLAPVLLVGNCMGSNIAAGIAARRPDDVVGLVLVNPLTAATFSAGWLGPLHTMARRAPGPTRAVRRLSRRIVPPRLAARATVRFQVGRSGRARGVHRDPELIAGNRRPDQLPALVDVLDDMDAYGALDAGRPGDTHPLCTIWGAQNRVLSPKAGRALDDRLAPERAERIDGCGHFPMLEEPEAVTAIVEAFAAEHFPAAAALTKGGER